ncbi:MAG: DUF1329 domain-containing protein [Pseudomonadales bacterium]|nr:DUF1329 domain-containing protein [Pseudomonadales bacterium]MCP5215825.1 DUF1329 domain-containing protein [Pseudomonadales bacterium]
MLFKSMRKSAFYVGFGVCLASLTFGAQAKELPEGTVISKANLDNIYEDTFEGHKIKDLLTERTEMWVRDYGLTLELEHSNELEFDPKLAEATQANVGKTSLSADNKLEGYVAGVPFPNQDVSVEDQSCGWKLAYNNYMANPVRGDDWIATGEVFIQDKERGNIDRFLAHNGVMRWEGRVRGEQRLPGRDNEHLRFLLVLTEPYDIAGIGVFTRQYNDASADDGYVYVRSLRRVRRTAGGKSWVDPQPKMDLLNDDSGGVTGYPGFYKAWKCVEKRHILAVVNAPDGNYLKKGKIDNIVNVDEAPHWNPIATKWQPREVFVIEGTPPDYHPYSKKVLYMDADYPFYYQGEFYDKKGDFWKIWQTRFYPYWRGDCNSAPGLGEMNSLAIDFQVERATYIHQYFNGHNCLSPQFMEPSILQKAASGAMQAELDDMTAAYKKRSLLPQHKARAEAWLNANR